MRRLRAAVACRCHATRTMPIHVDEGIKALDSTISNKDDHDDNDDNAMDTYAAAVISSDQLGNTEMRSKLLSVQQIINELPGTHPRDFFSLSLTSLGDASRKRRAMMMNQYSVKNTIHPWFILPRGSEIVVSLVCAAYVSFCLMTTNPRQWLDPPRFFKQMAFGCMRALITREKAFIFDAHKPTIKVRDVGIVLRATDCTFLLDSHGVA